MTRFLVFDTTAAAEAAESIIFARGAQVAALNGYEIDEAGGIVGMTPAGEPMPDAARTRRWDVPQQRLDGRWVFLHPENHPAAREPAWLAFVMDGIDAPAEEGGAGWFQDADEAADDA